MSKPHAVNVVLIGSSDGPRAKLLLARAARATDTGGAPLLIGRADGPAQLQKFAGVRAWVVADGTDVPPPMDRAAPGFVQLLECGGDWRRVRALQAAGTLVAGVAPALAPAVAHYAIGMVLLAIRGGAVFSDATRREVLTASRSRKAFASLSGKTVGIVGLGMVGEQVAALLAGSGAELQYAERRTAPQGLANELGIRRVTLDRLLSTSDVITVHVPWGPTADPLLGARELGLIGDKAVLVVTSDWQALDLRAASSSLRRGAIGRLALDAALPESGEHAGAANVLRSLPNVLVTPAVATKGREDDSSAADFALTNVRTHVSGRGAGGLIEVLDYPKAGDPSFWSSHMYPRARDSAS